MKKEQLDLFRSIVEEFLQSKDFQKMNQFIQHGDITTLDHSILVAYYSYAFGCYLHIRNKEEQLIRGALLHDYYLYDWHDHERWHKWHGFRHPFFALRQAHKDYELSSVEEEIIKKHMWPLTVIPPCCREAWIVCFIDTVSSLFETCMVYRPFHGLRQKWIKDILQPFETSLKK